MFINTIEGMYSIYPSSKFGSSNSLPRSVEDFCLWGSPTPDGVIGNIEAVVVAYCTKPGHGTRLIPPGTLTAV